MTDLTITCPHCAGRIELTEALAAPLMQDMEQEFALRMGEKDRAVAERERLAAEHERRNRAQQAKIEEQVAKRERELRESLRESARRAAREEMAIEIDEAAQINKDLQNQVKSLDEKARLAATERAALRQKERELAEQRADLQREVQDRLTAELPALREKAAEQARSDLELRMAQKDQKLEQMQRHIDDLQRSAHLGSQQLQGAAGEAMIRDRLSAAYPGDSLEKVKTGVRGGDLMQTVVSRSGSAVGRIIWEVKQAKTFQNSWLAKLKQDRGRSTAEVAVLVSPVLPVGCESFGQVDGVWLVTPDLAVPLAEALRQELLSLSIMRTTMTGRDTKATRVYDYLHGPVFRARVSDLVSAAATMRDVQTKLRDVIHREMARADAQILRMRDACMGMQGDLMDTIGEDIAEIDTDNFKRLEDQS